MHRKSWTIGIPTFNRYSMMLQALGSAQRQSVQPDRIIITDNCSDDETQWFDSRHHSPSIRYLKHSTPIKPFDNFLSSLSLCDTEYFSWLQDDDYLFPEFGRHAIAAMDADSCSTAAVSYAFLAKDIGRLRNRETKIWGPPPFSMDFDRLTPFIVPKYSLLPWMTHFWPGFSPVAIYRTADLRKCIDELPPINDCTIYLLEQYLFSALNKRGSIACIPSVLGVLREHKNRVTNEFSYSQQEWDRAMLGLYDYLLASMPIEIDAVERFLAENLVVLDAEELAQFRATLIHYNHPMSTIVLTWIDKYSPAQSEPLLPQAPASEVQKNSHHIVKRLARNILPPAIPKLLKIIANRSSKSKPA